MNNEDLIKIRNMLVKITSFVDKSIVKDINGCLCEENVINLTTMGTEFKKYQCFDCGKTWEEKFEESNKDFADLSGTIGVKPNATRGS